MISSIKDTFDFVKEAAELQKQLDQTLCIQNERIWAEGVAQEQGFEPQSQPGASLATDHSLIRPFVETSTQNDSVSTVYNIEATEAQMASNFQSDKVFGSDDSAIETGNPVVNVSSYIARSLGGHCILKQITPLSLLQACPDCQMRLHTHLIFPQERLAFSGVRLKLNQQSVGESPEERRPSLDNGLSSSIAGQSAAQAGRGSKKRSLGSMIGDPSEPDDDNISGSSHASRLKFRRQSPGDRENSNIK